MDLQRFLKTASEQEPVRAVRRSMVVGLPALALCPAVMAQDTGGDPFGSFQWPVMRKEFLGEQARVSFDERVRVTGPVYAEDAMNVPVTLDATAIEGIRRIMVLVDRNPIRKVLEFEPLKVKPVLSFRFKLEQASPVRVAVQVADGSWRVGGTRIDASGGGCTVSGASRADGSWTRTLGQVSSRAFPLSGQAGERIRVRVMHPMDTGLVAGIPAFYIRQLNLSDEASTVWARLALFEPVSENPMLSFDFPAKAPDLLRLSGMDNNGNRIDAGVLK